MNAQIWLSLTDPIGLVVLITSVWIASRELISFLILFCWGWLLYYCYSYWVTQIQDLFSNRFPSVHVLYQHLSFYPLTAYIPLAVKLATLYSFYLGRYYQWSAFDYVAPLQTLAFSHTSTESTTNASRCKVQSYWWYGISLWLYSLDLLITDSTEI